MNLLFEHKKLITFFKKYIYYFFLVSWCREPKNDRCEGPPDIAKETTEEEGEGRQTGGGGAKAGGKRDEGMIFESCLVIFPLLRGR